MKTATRFRWLLVATAITLVGSLLSPVSAQPWRDDPVQILTLSNRADLISGGDVLVEVVLPDRVDATQVTVTAGETDVTDAFAVRADGRYLGRVEGLAVGATRLTASLPDGSGAHLGVTNRPVGGPVFAGPQVQPWTCTTEEHGLGPAEDEQCNTATVFDLLYMPEDGSGFAAYDPAAPPADVATTTTDEGVEVPYIVRRERGVIDRGVYDIAVLYDPEQPWEPWAPQEAWNQKVYWRFGGDCNPSHRQPGTEGTNAPGVLDDHALSQGFAVAFSGLNVLGRNCNDVVSAEAVVMIKEHLIEQYGEVRYTFSDGGSGGSMQQHWIVSNYPGVLDGIMPRQSYPDVWQTLLEAEDCVLLDRAFVPAGIISPVQITAVTGHESVRACNASGWTLFAKIWQDPTFEFACQGGASSAPASAEPAPWVYDPMTNPEGARCTLQDYQKALFGLRPPDVWGAAEEAAGGFANSPFDNIGVEYGRHALEDGAITATQFVALNEQVGGYDIDWAPQADRKVADPAALEAAYRGGRVTFPRAAARVPILDIRLQNPCNSDPALEIHTCFHTYAMRARLEAANGHADNQVILYQPPANYAFDLMDEWLTAIEADDSADPLEDKVLANKPGEAVHACWSEGERDTDWAHCQELNPHFGNPRLAAGGPLAGNILKCQLKPLDRADYGVEFTDVLWSRLEAAFPDGVCDYSVPGVAQEESIPWLTYLAEDGSAIPGGQPLGDPPVSVPFGPEGSSALVTRHGGATRVETAVAVSSSGVEAADTVVIARADDFPDALAGGPLAVHLQAPLLLTSPGGLSAAVAEEIQRLGATQAVLLGGEQALAPQVATDVQDLGLEVRRIAGESRWATAAAIAAEVGVADGVLLARGDDFADAVSASGLGAATGIPVLLTEPDRLPEETRGALSAEIGVTIIGGTAAVAEAVASEVDASAGDVGRVAGQTRYGTSAAVADAALAAGVTPSITWVATGGDFPDALVAGAAAGRDQGVLLLVDGRDLGASTETDDWLAAHRADIDNIRIAGGLAAISEAVEMALSD